MFTSNVNIKAQIQKKERFILHLVDTICMDGVKASWELVMQVTKNCS